MLLRSGAFQIGCAALKPGATGFAGSKFQARDGQPLLHAAVGDQRRQRFDQKRVVVGVDHDRPAGCMQIILIAQ